MKQKELKVLYLSSAEPRPCGIATFVNWLSEAIRNLDLNVDQKIIAINEPRSQKRDYPSWTRYELDQEELKSYEKTINYINNSGADVLCLQHEFGLWGGLTVFLFFCC